MKKTYLNFYAMLVLMIYPIGISAYGSSDIRSCQIAFAESTNSEIVDKNLPKINGIISSAFGYRKHPISGTTRNHDGVDLIAKKGTKVYASGTGTVTFSGWRFGYGNVVEIDHKNGYIVSFAHNSKNLVKVNDSVTNETIIAISGSTGWVTGPHVHVEIRYDGQLIDPQPFVYSEN